MRRTRLFHLFIAVFGLALFAGAAHADKPSVIRLAYPGVGVGNRPFSGGNSVATVHLKGLLEEEFKRDGIKVEWVFLRGAGPATNELYANGLADFSLLGDLPSIIGRSSGLKTRILAATAIRGNTYLAVPADSSIQSIKDLKGKRVGFQKGTNIQLAVNKILQAHGLAEKDIRAISMDSTALRLALVTKDLDAVFWLNDLLALRDQGIAKIVYSTANDPRYLRHCSFVGSDDFIRKYPEITKRVVKQVVIAAKWLSDQEANPQTAYQLWTKSGVRFADYKEDNKGVSLKVLSSPLIDPYLVSQYKIQVSEAKRFGLIKNPFEVEPWIDTSFLNEALKELGLENYWAPVPASGAVKNSS